MSFFRNCFAYCAKGILWALHFLPLKVLAPLGQGVGFVLYCAGRQRRHVAQTNLALCFPTLSPAARQTLLREHFSYLGRSLLERGVLWWAPRTRLEKLLQIEGLEIVEELLAQNTPVILLAPHFLGLDAGGTAITLHFNAVNLYAEQSNPILNKMVLNGRLRFGDQKLLSRQEGILATVKAMRSGRPFHYSPDTNARRRDAVFVPFFGTAAATTSGLPRLAKAGKAVVVPCVTTFLPNQQGYRITLSPPWENYPSSDLKEDLLRMNAWLESQIRQQPAQYYWVHRRFKTRPLGEPKLY